MTRINVVPVSELVDKHLIAEYRELPRIYSLAKKFYDSKKDISIIPKEYVLGLGHVKFFYNKLSFIYKRHNELIIEMKKRGFKPTFDGSIPKDIILPKSYWLEYKPTESALKINRERIKLRMPKNKS